MTDPEFQAQISRLRALRPKVWDDYEKAGRDALASELWRKFGHLPLPTWIRIIDRVIDFHEGKDLPAFSSFLYHARAVHDSLGPSEKPDPISREARASSLQVTALSMTPAQARHTLSMPEAKALPADIRKLLEEIAATVDKSEGRV